MRLAFLILLLANLALFLWGQGYLGVSAAGREPERLGRQKVPEKLRILPPDTAPAPFAVPPRPALACRRIEWLGKDEAASLRDTLGTLPDWQVALKPQPQEPAHWVVIPSLAGRDQAERKKLELQKLGVKQGEIVEDARLGPFVVSIGVFRERERADELLESLTKKGVRSAQIGMRELPANKFSVELNAPASVLDVRLPDLMATLPQATIRDCAIP